MLMMLVIQVTQVQLETLKIENQHLTEILEEVESRSPKVCVTPGERHRFDLIYSQVQ